MIGGYAKGSLPCVVHISIARYSKELPEEGELLQFLVSIHVEGAGITWQQNATLDRQAEQDMLAKAQSLYLWSLNAALTKETAQRYIRELGKELHAVFIGQKGKEVLASLQPTAILFDVDETIQNLPWELLGEEDEALSLRYPFGRLVTTRIMPRRPRDPLQEDAVVKVLAVVANPTHDLISGKWEVAALKRLEERRWGRFQIEVTVLEDSLATKASFLETIADGSFDIIHFSGHGAFDILSPGRSGINLTDGLLTADELLAIHWTAPPYLVVGSSCESGRAAGGQRLVSNDSHSNGIAAAFLAMGVSAYAGYYWPVTEDGAAKFTEVFYTGIFELENVGYAFMEARRSVKWEFDEVGDLTVYSAVFYGDAASGERPNLATAD